MPKREHGDVDVSVEVREAKSPISDEDNARYRAFLSNYEAKLEGGIQLVSDFQRSDDEVQHRKNIIKKSVLKLRSALDKNFDKVGLVTKDGTRLLDHINFYSENFYGTNYGAILHFSDMLMSYLLTQKCFVPDINFKVYNLRNFLDSMTLQPGSGDEIYCKTFFKTFLIESKLKKHMANFMERKKSTQDSVTIVRRATLICLTRRVKHECFAYWELLVDAGSPKLRFGVCDNISQKSYVDLVDFRMIYQRVIAKFVKKYSEHVGELQVECFHVHNRLGYNREQTIYKCTSLCRRALLYFSILRDITAFHENTQLESNVDWSTAHLPMKVSKVSMKMYRRNVVAYFYHLRRIQDWLLSNPMIWPSSVEQPEPTADSPVCSIVFHPLYNHQISLADPSNVVKFLTLDSRLQMFKLVSHYDFSERYYRFKWDGDSPFQMVPAKEAVKLWENFAKGWELCVPEDRESCVMQAGYVPIELNEQHLSAPVMAERESILTVVKSLHNRLAALEKKYVDSPKTLDKSMELSGQYNSMNDEQILQKK